MLTEQDVLTRISQGESAHEILRSEMPNAERRFRKLCQDMGQFINDVQKVFPDAGFYTASGGFSLLLGNSHSFAGKPQQELSALTNSGRFYVGDGDF